MRSASAERSRSPRSNNVVVPEHRPALNRGDNSRSIHDPIRGRIDRLAEIQSKSDRLLGVSTRQRDRMLPQVPTISESGVPEFDTENWFGVAAPAKVSSEVVARVGQAIREATELPDLQRRMSTLGFNLDFRNSEQFRELIVKDHQKYGAIIREAGI
jgi:tripartite-type tricarboxylate transporter receptor subunit TctC